MKNRKWSTENFEIHHSKNPHIYQLFCRFALQAAERRDYFSAKAIFHRMRWYTLIEENESEFKLDDGWISHYARKFMEDYPQHKGFFETRVRRGGYFERRTEPQQEALL